MTFYVYVKGMYVRHELNPTKGIGSESRKVKPSEVPKTYVVWDISGLNFSLLLPDELAQEILTGHIPIKKSH